MLSLLRGFELRHDGEPVELPPSAQRLLAFLALQHGQVLRVYVAGTLWLDFPQDAANASLRTTLWRLRQPEFALVQSTTAHVALADGVAVDLDEVSRYTDYVISHDGAGRGGSDGYAHDGALQTLMRTGDLLPDWYEDWVVIARERFRQQRLHALEAICDELVAEGRYGLALEAGLAGVAVEPLRESSHRAVMRAHLAEGNRNEALRQYELCRRLLDQQLGLDPSPETMRLRDRCEVRDAPVTADDAARK